MRSCSLFVPLVFMLVNVQAQDKKTMKEHKISQRIETVIDYENGLDDKRVDLEQFFDKEGRLIEYKDWTKDGKIKEWFKYVYNEDGTLHSEELIDSKGKMDERVVFSYENGVKTKKSYYDSKERLTKEKFYDYQYYK